MRKTLLGFMTLLMLTPVLMCGMAFCPSMANASDLPPCHQMDDRDSLMLVVDCMGVDLFAQYVSNDIQPDQSLDNIDYPWVAIVAGYNFNPDHVNSIRGPPDRAQRSQSEASILLTTQRFRI